MKKKALRVKGAPCWREDGTRLKVPPGPCEIEEAGAVVRIIWQQHGREHVELLLDED